MKRRRTRRMAARSAFTLMEVMLVLVIIAAIASLAIMNWNTIGGRANQRAAKAKIEVLKQAVDLYRLDMLSYPPDLNALHEQPNNLPDPSKWTKLLKEPVGLDPWGRPYEYTMSGDTYEIRSLGADGQRSDDDIVG
jgi:general secretion pathway protein G